MKLLMTNCQSTIIHECEIPEITRDNIALTYRFCLEADKEGREKIDWLKINTAIINRWSKAGLKYIKEKAWSGN